MNTWANSHLLGQPSKLNTPLALIARGAAPQRIKGPSSRIGLQRGGADVHDGITSVADRLKRQQLAEVGAAPASSAALARFPF